jgi:hypothetical protein
MIPTFFFLFGRLGQVGILATWIKAPPLSVMTGIGQVLGDSG